MGTLMDRANAMNEDRKGETVLKDALKAQLETACTFYKGEDVKSHFQKLGSKIQVALKIGGVHNINYAVGVLFKNIVS